MSDQLSKLRPDRDLQCYFLQPSAIAALSATSQTGFTVSGSWRQQADWTVVEWNRDNVFEHPLLRNLPDGDLSGICLSYQEIRTNCIPFDSLLWPTVDWPYLRVWADSGGIETLYQVPLAKYATPFAGGYSAPTAQFELQGSVTAGDYIELSWLDQHFNYRLSASDSLSTAVSALADIITTNQQTGAVTATASGSRITLTYIGIPGANGNRVGVYGTVHGACTESWTPAWAMFNEGTSPTSWQVSLKFGSLVDLNGVTIPAGNVRKLRWTWAADLQPANFQRTEFSVVISNWNVTGTNLAYSVAGPGTRRIENDSIAVSYQGAWSTDHGNFSGGSIHWTTIPGDFLICSFSMPTAHSLYLGTRYADTAAAVAVQIDSGVSETVELQLAYYQNQQRTVSGEDALVRIPLGQLSGQSEHTVKITHSGLAGSYFYFDFLEMALPAVNTPVCAPVPTTSLATDWDTLHSIAIAPERTAWLIQALGFHGRVNHYAGALWFYELCASGYSYATANLTFAGVPEFGKVTSVTVAGTAISHLNLIGDTAESIATCFALLINAGSTGIWAKANGAVLTITARTMGASGNGISISAATDSSEFTASPGSTVLAGGIDGKWLTDLGASQPINRACRDWSVSFFRALSAYGIAVTASFSTELGNGDDSTSAAIAQRYPDGSAVWVNTPALQTNFSPASAAYWQQVYQAMATLMATAGVVPYLQFGEVQWWYFANPAGMPFYDAYTTSTFQAQYGRALPVIASQNADPGAYPDECVFLASLIGQFTKSIMDAVLRSRPDTRFEVLYPPDVNDTPLNRIVNYPTSYWTPENLSCLKTENFTYTGNRDLDQARKSIQLPASLGFPPGQSSHLVGIGDYATPWNKERKLAIAAGVESVVLFALDQFCLIGYPLSFDRRAASSRYLG